MRLRLEEMGWPGAVWIRIGSAHSNHGGRVSFCVHYTCSFQFKPLAWLIGGPRLPTKDMERRVFVSFASGVTEIASVAYAQKQSSLNAI